MGRSEDRVNYDRHEKSILPSELKTHLAAIIFAMTTNANEWMRKFAHKDVAVPDHLSVVMGFAGMLSGAGNADDAERSAADHGSTQMVSSPSPEPSLLARAWNEVERERYFVFSEFGVTVAGRVC